MQLSELPRNAATQAVVMSRLLREQQMSKATGYWVSGVGDGAKIQSMGRLIPK